MYGIQEIHFTNARKNNVEFEIEKNKAIISSGSEPSVAEEVGLHSKLPKLKSVSN